MFQKFQMYTGIFSILITYEWMFLGGKNSYKLKMLEDYAI